MTNVFELDIGLPYVWGNPNSRPRQGTLMILLPVSPGISTLDKFLFLRLPPPILSGCVDPPVAAPFINTRSGEKKSLFKPATICAMDTGNCLVLAAQ
jgi:hypothetical protein